MPHDAVILAAGYGSRLAALSSSKPLAPICGVSLIELSVRQLVASGARRIVVVTGHDAARVEAELGRLAQALDVEIIAERLGDWSRPNGWSVLAGARRVSSPFLLVMADHIFGDGLLARLARTSLDGCDVILATDRTDNPLVDPEDATWVALRDERAIAWIGKNIEPYDRVDCGAFLANHELVSAIEQAIAEGRPGSLSDGMQVLADRGRAQVMDIDGAWWIDVDDPHAHSQALREVRDHLGLYASERADA